jgi:hypothetical protein
MFENNECMGENEYKRRGLGSGCCWRMVKNKIVRIIAGDAPWYTHHPPVYIHIPDPISLFCILM